MAEFVVACRLASDCLRSSSIFCSSSSALYRFGQTVSVVMFTENWRPESWFDRILENRALGLHTLCLLDLKIKEQSVENLLRGRAVYEPPRFLSAPQAAAQLVDVAARRPGCGIGRDTEVVGLARVGCAAQQVVYCSLSQLADTDLGPPLHSLVVPGEPLHPMEARFVERFRPGGAGLPPHSSAPSAPLK